MLAEHDGVVLSLIRKVLHPLGQRGSEEWEPGRCGEGDWLHGRKASHLNVCRSARRSAPSESRETALNVPQNRSICAQAPRAPCTRKSHPGAPFLRFFNLPPITLVRPLVDFIRRKRGEVHSGPLITCTSAGRVQAPENRLAAASWWKHPPGPRRLILNFIRPVSAGLSSEALRCRFGVHPYHARL